MLKRIHTSQRKSRPYDVVSSKKSSKDAFTFFGLLNPKEVLRKTCKGERMSSLRRDTSSRKIREGSFIAKDDNYYRKSTANVLCEILYLTLHFILVLSVLLSAAVIFAKIEDPPSKETERFNRTAEDQEISKLLKNNYNITISTIDVDKFINDVNSVARFTKLKKIDSIKTKNHDGKFVFKKWFYFASIASTTIGYGDVTPKTSEGRIIYIIFSLIAIPLMFSFIISCGDKVRQLVTGLLSIFKQCVAGQQEKGSSFHLLASLMIFISFAGHFSVGCALIHDTNKWTLVDKIYHHVVTFTTVGFGDVIEPLEDQVNNAVPLLFYRVFGLVLLYAGLKSFHSWYKVKREAFAVRKLIQRPLKSRRQMSALACFKAKGQEEPKLESTMLI